MAFKFGCCIVQYNFAGFTFEQALASMKRLGFTGVETHGPREVLSRGKTELKRLLDANGLEPAKFLMGGYGVESGAGALADTTPEGRRSTLESYKRNVMVAQDNGFPAMVIFTGPIPEGIPEERAFALAAQSLGPIADIAEAHGVELAIETHRGALASDSSTFLKLRELTGSKNVYANVDPSNYWTVGEDVVAAVKKLGTLVRGVHAKDVIEVEGKAYWAPAGSGLVDWGEFLGALKAIGYDESVGWVDIEYEAGITGKFGRDPEKGSRDSLEHIVSVLKRV